MVLLANAKQLDGTLMAVLKKGSVKKPNVLNIFSVHLPCRIPKKNISIFLNIDFFIEVNNNKYITHLKGVLIYHREKIIVVSHMLFNLSCVLPSRLV